MERTGRQRPARPNAVRRWSGTVGSGVLAWLVGGRLALLVVAAGFFLLLAVIAAVIAGAAVAPGAGS
jgi:predicted lipid-binding transport protein (Tim44 family)